MMKMKRLEKKINDAERKSEDKARKKYGDATVNQAIKAAITLGAVRAFMAKPDPFEALVKWFSQQQKLSSFDPKLHDRANKSEARARKKWGHRAVDDATTYAILQGINHKLMLEKDPYKALMKLWLDRNLSHRP